MESYNTVLISLSIMSLRFIHVVACVSISFLFKANILHFRYIPYVVIHRYLGCFPFLAIMNNAAMNRGV